MKRPLLKNPKTKTISAYKEENTGFPNKMLLTENVLYH